MRASTFSGCKFVRAILRGADPRRSSFDGCDFTGAELAGAVGEDEYVIACVQEYLSAEQQAVILESDSGPVPPGG